MYNVMCRYPRRSDRAARTRISKQTNWKKPRSLCAFGLAVPGVLNGRFAEETNSKDPSQRTANKSPTRM